MRKGGPTMCGAAGRSQLTAADTAADTAICACGMQRHVAEGQCPPTISSWRPTCPTRGPQKASQAHIAVASRTSLSRRRTNPRAFASFPEDMPDSEILAASFKLSDAQEMVARQQGFDSWQALKTGLSTTSLKVKSSPSKATIVSAKLRNCSSPISRDHANFSVRN